jgi:hypothetical protein
LQPFGCGEVKAVFLNFGFVSAQLQGFTNLRLCRSLAKIQKSSLQMVALFIQTLLFLAMLGVKKTGASNQIRHGQVFCFTPSAIRERA